MSLEIQKKKDGVLRSKWWYGRFKVNGSSKFINLGIEIRGKVPKTLKETGDTAFERSRMMAQLKLEEQFLLFLWARRTSPRCGGGLGG